MSLKKYMAHFVKLGLNTVASFLFPVKIAAPYFTGKRK